MSIFVVVVIFVGTSSAWFNTSNFEDCSDQEDEDWDLEKLKQVVFGHLDN